MLCRWRRPASSRLQEAAARPRPARRGHDSVRAPNVMADSGNSLVEDSTPSTLNRGVSGSSLGLGPAARPDGVTVSAGSGPAPDGGAV